MNAASKNEAVALAVQLLSSHNLLEGIMRGGYETNVAELVLRDLCGISFDDDGCKISEAGASLLAEDALKFREVYDLAVKVSSWNLIRNKPVPSGLEYIAGHALSGFEKPKSKVSKNSKGSTFLRNALFIHALKVLEEVFAISPTHRHTRSEYEKQVERRKPSGAELVAEASAQLGFPEITHDMVINAWKDKKNHRLLDRLNL